MLRKAQKMYMYVQFSNFSKPETTSWSLTPQLDTEIIEVSLVKGLSLRANPLRLYSAKHLPLMNWTYGDTDKDEDENMQFFFKPLLTCVMTKSDLPSVTTQIFPMTCSSWALYTD